VRRILLISVVGLAGWLTPALAHAATTAVVLSDPSNGALLNGGQPQFSGAADFASNAGDQVVVNLYSGSTAGGTPVRALGASISSGAFSASASGLADGTYTAQAVASDGSGDSASSQAVTFQLFNGQPQLSLSAPPGPIQTAAPTFTGTALTTGGDSGTAYLVIYAANNTDSTPVAVLSGQVGAGGAFSIQVLPGLPAGVYTAVATQPVPGGTAFSGDVAFTITSTAASLTVTSPAPGASEPQTGVVFDGTAGGAYGDSTAITLVLYRGGSATGTALGTETVTRSDTSWSERWPTSLALGIDTLAVTQTNVAGMPTTVTHTFTVAPPGSVTGAVTISARGRLSAKLSCLDGAGTCRGDVLIVTRESFEPTPGGPRGPLSLMFQRFSVAADQTGTLSTQLTAGQLRVLRRAGGTPLKVTVAYSVAGHLTEATHTTGSVKVR
jgi:hypothetical protein